MVCVPFIGRTIWQMLRMQRQVFALKEIVCMRDSEQQFTMGLKLHLVHAKSTVEENTETILGFTQDM